MKRLLLPILLVASACAGTGATYYIDAAGGDDTNSGDQGKPWKSMAKAMTEAQSGDTFILADGEYGFFVEKEAPGKRTDWITFRAAEKAAPVLTGIHIARTEPDSAYLRFDGLTVKVDWVDPQGDPQQPESSAATYKDTATPLTLRGASKVEFKNGKLLGTNKYLTRYAFSIEKCQDILVEKTEMTKISSGGTVAGSENVTLRRNHIHEIIGSGIKALQNNRNLLIEYNHIHNSNWSVKDDYAPRAEKKNPHASAVSIRTSNITLRYNMFHSIGSSSGLMFYETDKSNKPISSTKSELQTEGYSNILIENNLIYDPQNTPLRMYHLGKNVVLKNNTFVSYIFPGREEQLYLVALVHSLAQEDGGAGLSVYNNIFVGEGSSFPPNAKVKGNIFGEWRVGKSTVPPNQIPAGNRAFRNEGGGISSWMNDFFIKPPDLRRRHNTVQDFRLHPKSPAVNFGDPEHQTARGLGTLDENGFLQDDGIARDDQHHSAGCYEFSVGASP